MTREETAANTELQNMVKYLLRHHVHNFGVTALHGHHVMKFGYGLNMHDNLASSPSLAILPASIFIAETFNAALSNVVVRDSETIDVRRKRLEEEADIVCDMYYTMNKYSGYLGFPTIIRTLGKKKFTICKKNCLKSLQTEKLIAIVTRFCITFLGAILLYPSNSISNGRRFRTRCCC